MSNIGVTSMPKTYKSFANANKALVDTAFKKGQDYRKGIFYMDSTENWEDRIVEIGGIEDYGVWDDGDRAKQSSISEGYSKVFTQVPFGNEVPIGRLMRKFQGKSVNITRRASIQLGNRAYRLMQKAAFSIPSYGFSTTNTYLTGITGTTVSALGPDGVNFFSSAHPCSPTNSTTFSNVDTTSKPVGGTGLDNLLQGLFDQKDDQGEKEHFGTGGVIWGVGREGWATAKKLVTGELAAETSDNDQNPYNNSKTATGAYNGSDVEVKLIPWLSDVSSTAHFVVAKEVIDERMPVCVLTNEQFYVDDYMDDSTKTAYIRGQMNFSVGFVSGRGYHGSNGTEVTYSS